MLPAQGVRKHSSNVRISQEFLVVQPREESNKKKASIYFGYPDKVHKGEHAPATVSDKRIPHTNYAGWIDQFIHLNRFNRLDWSIHPFESIQLAGLVNLSIELIQVDELINTTIRTSQLAGLIIHPFESIQLA
uniref:Uncharacterized protein n=1 Tax=Ditylenchus dipsaci TaxID=166011 RepID=A0A915DGP8_9BILA